MNSSAGKQFVNHMNAYKARFLSCHLNVGAARTVRAPCIFFIWTIYLTPLFCFVSAP